VNAEVDLMDWEADGSAVEVMAAIGIEEVCAVEATSILVGGGIGEELAVVEVDYLI
ncbi:hypothetical protein KI387_029535, partial [Taxus chinensis]